MPKHILEIKVSIILQLPSHPSPHMHGVLGKGTSFLDTEEGKVFIDVFKAIRLKHILNDKPSIVTIEEDGVIPKGKMM